ncbi:MAG: hypothetical protein ACTHJJ_06330 [Intrasporangium sp.]
MTTNLRGNGGGLRDSGGRIAMAIVVGLLLVLVIVAIVNILAARV